MKRIFTSLATAALASTSLFAQVKEYVRVGNYNFFPIEEVNTITFLKTDVTGETQFYLFGFDNNWDSSCTDLDPNLWMKPSEEEEGIYKLGVTTNSSVWFKLMPASSKEYAGSDNFWNYLLGCPYSQNGKVDLPMIAIMLEYTDAFYIKNPGNYTITFNAKELTVTVEDLSPKTTPMWYLVGNHFGCKWGSSVGETALPMFENPSDYAQENGLLSYTNYFITGDYVYNECTDAGFKIQPSDFNWDCGMTGDFGQKGTIIYRNQGDDGGHIVAPANGYYTIILDTKEKTASFTPLDITPALHNICIAGDFSGWQDIQMLPYNTEGIENHVWYYLGIFEENCQFKFKEYGTWDTNWGGTQYPIGTGVQDGSNITLTSGKKLIIFNDIDATYNIISLDE